MSADLLYGTAVLLATAGVALFATGLWLLLRGRFLDRRLRTFVAMEPGPSAAPAPAGRPGPAGGRAPSPLGQGIQRRLIRTSYGAMVQARLNRAGLARKPSEIIIAQVVLGLMLALAGVLAAPGPTLGRTLTAALLGAVGVAAPLFWLSRRAASRLALFEKQLPQAIDAMASTLQAGSSLQQAMAILAQEMPPPIAVEFQRVLREAELGLSFPDSLAGMAQRVRSADLVIFTSAISIQQRVGGDLARIFRVISNTIRERLRIRGDTRVLTTQGRYSAYVVGGLPIALFVFLWLTNYTYLSGLFLPGVPRVLLGAGVVGMLLGFYSMNKIAAVEV